MSSLVLIEQNSNDFSNFQKSLNIQEEINLRKKNGYKVVSCVMCNHGQQQYFIDVIKLSIQTENIFYFFVNDYHVDQESKLDEFESYHFILQDEYLDLQSAKLKIAGTGLAGGFLKCKNTSTATVEYATLSWSDLPAISGLDAI